MAYYKENGIEIEADDTVELTLFEGRNSVWQWDIQEDQTNGAFSFIQES